MVIELFCCHMFFQSLVHLAFDFKFLKETNHCTSCINWGHPHVARRGVSLLPLLRLLPPPPPLVLCFWTLVVGMKVPVIVRVLIIHRKMVLDCQLTLQNQSVGHLLDCLGHIMKTLTTGFLALLAHLCIISLDCCMLCKNWCHQCLVVIYFGKLSAKAICQSLCVYAVCGYLAFLVFPYPLFYLSLLRN